MKSLFSAVLLKNAKTKFSVSCSFSNALGKPSTDNVLINNNSQLPPTLFYKTNERLPSLKITNDNILKTIARLDPNKAHGKYKISFE